jgi:hypothetical protein
VKPLWEVVQRGDEYGLEYSFHLGQQRAWNSTARTVAMIAGFQSGKTSFEPLWLHREIEERGPGDYLAVTATFPLLELKMLPEFLHFFGPETLNLGEWVAKDHLFRFWDHKTRILFGSAVNAESLESATAKGAVCDEAGQNQFRLEAMDAVQRRLVLYKGRTLIGTTPYNMGWLKQQVFDRWAAGNPMYDVIQFPCTYNPMFPVEEYERLKAEWPEWKFRLFCQGLFTRPAGAIYGDYVDSLREKGGHLVVDFPIPPSWPQYVGLDFGGVNTALVWLAKDPATNVFYLHRESLTGNKTTKQHATEAKARAKGYNVLVWCGGAKGETQQRRDWGAEGVPVQPPPVSDVESGLDKVTELFKTHRLFIFESCKGVRDELGTYSRELDSNGEPTEAIRDKNDFHRLDGLRYGVLGAQLGSTVWGRGPGR